MQRQFLEIYIRHHAEPPTEFSLVAEMMHFRRAWKVLLQWVAIAILAGLGYYAIALFLSGMIVGGVAAHLDGIIKFAKLRPLIEVIVAWPKVHELLSTEETTVDPLPN